MDRRKDDGKTNEVSGMKNQTVHCLVPDIRTNLPNVRKISCLH